MASWLLHLVSLSPFPSLSPTWPSSVWPGPLRTLPDASAFDDALPPVYDKLAPPPYLGRSCLFLSFYLFIFIHLLISRASLPCKALSTSSFSLQSGVHTPLCFYTFTPPLTPPTPTSVLGIGCGRYDSSLS